MKERLLFTKKDFLLIIILLTVALISFATYAVLNQDDGKPFCQISYNGVSIQTVNLSKNVVIELPQNPNVRFEVKDDSIAFIESDCPDKICIHSGFLNQPGQMAACLPNRVLIRIIAAETNDVDMIAN